ncbi:hypothetical protein NQ315_007987 [Exocentrus adspersus]|uniref:Tyr recombinase domain-containing protein n=1 Tax=Exocentrus adspersus TaxID=1586481 RepID=A0AAV8VFC3_9CUCU|nr:hypothetical protein NQ315_007987 [Exocentrus adspersus]
MAGFAAFVVVLEFGKNASVPVAVFEEAQRAIFHLLPAKSRKHYEKVFAEFNEWREKRGVMTINEEVMISYFLNLKKKYAVSSLWSKYSMLKATIKVYKNTDIGKYSCTHIMRISGACRCCELTNLKSTHVKGAGSYLLVSIPDTKTGILRKFTIIEEGFCVNAIEICRKYISLRPIRQTQNRFFLRYMNQKCTSQPVGINTLAKVPSIVASFLNFPNAELYTGHCMRRTSTTLLANKGADLTTTKRHGGWKSSAVAESYIEDSISNKLDISRKVQGESNVTRSENDGNNPTRVVINGKKVACEKTKNEMCTYYYKWFICVDKSPIIR